MALIDSGLERARLDQDELAAAVRMVSEPRDSSIQGEAVRAAIERLSEAGALDSYGLIGWFARLIRVVAAPELRAVAELHAGDQHAVVAIAWCGTEQAVLGRLTSGNETELRAVEPATLPAAFAGEVGFAPRPARPDRTPITASAIEIERALAGEGDEALQRVMKARVRSWRVTASAETRMQSLGVLDAGAEGLWLSEQNDDRPDLVTLTPTNAETVVNGLLALFAAQVLPAGGSGPSLSARG